MEKKADILKRKKDNSVDQYNEKTLTEEELNKVTGGKFPWEKGKMVPGGGVCASYPL